MSTEVSFRAAHGSFGHVALGNRMYHLREAYQLAEFRPPLASHVMRRYTVVTAEIRNDLVDERVALDLTKDRRSMPSELLGNDPNIQASHSPASNLASFIQIDMGVGAFHCVFLASDNPLVSFASRTSSLNPPHYNTKNR